jgi:dTDP-4-amino-4,6-dideoxygalactose transaminase
MPAIMAWAAQHSILIVEDCAQAHGASINGRHVGTFGDAAVWSFCNDKILTTGGEGGMFASRDKEIWKLAWSFGEHGKDYDAAMRSVPGAAFQWLVEHEGTNMRMTEMQAAIGRCHLERLSDDLGKRRANMTILHNQFESIKCIRAPKPPDGHAGYRYAVYVQEGTPDIPSYRSQLLAAITNDGWPANSGSCPEIYREPFFQALGLKPIVAPTAKSLGHSSITFLVHPTIDEETMRRYAGGISGAIATNAIGAAQYA